MKKHRASASITKKHLARSYREKQQVTWILICASLVFVISLSAIVYGLIEEKYLYPRQPVVKINDVKISTKDFETRVKFARQQIIQKYYSTYQTMQYFGEDPNTKMYFQNTLDQMQQQLDSPEILGQSVIDDLTNDELIRQKAAEEGITVSDSAILEAIQADFGYYPAGTATPMPTIEVKPTSTLSATQYALVTATPTFTPSPVPTKGLDISPTPTLQEIDTTPTVTSVPTLTPTPYTLEGFQSAYQSVLSDLESQIGITKDDIQKIYAARLLREKMVEKLTQDLPKEEDRVWARHILVPSAELAASIRERLISGEDWNALAAELSTDDSNKDKGGDLGWFNAEKMVTEFSQKAFAMEIGEISEPVKTQFGWHIIQVLGHETQSLDSYEYSQKQQQYFDKWLLDQKAGAKIITYDYWMNRVPMVPTLPPQFQSASNQPTEQTQP